MTAGRVLVLDWVVADDEVREAEPDVLPDPVLADATVAPAGPRCSR